MYEKDHQMRDECKIPPDEG